MHFVSQHRYRLRCIQSILITLHTLKPTHKSSNAREILQEQTTSQRNIEGLDESEGRPCRAAFCDLLLLSIGWCLGSHELENILGRHY